MFISLVGPYSFQDKKNLSRSLSIVNSHSFIHSSFMFSLSWPGLRDIQRLFLEHKKWEYTMDGTPIHQWAPQKQLFCSYIRQFSVVNSPADMFFCRCEETHMHRNSTQTGTWSSGSNQESWRCEVATLPAAPPCRLHSNIVNHVCLLRYL